MYLFNFFNKIVFFNLFYFENSSFKNENKFPENGFNRFDIIFLF